MSKYVDDEWYVVFDGTSHFALMGFDIPEAQDEGPCIEVVSGPYDYDEVDIECERLNSEI